MIFLGIEDDEIPALRVALIGLINDHSEGPAMDRWRAAASRLFTRLEAATNEADE